MGTSNNDYWVQLYRARNHARKDPFIAMTLSPQMSGNGLRSRFRKLGRSLSRASSKVYHSPFLRGAVNVATDVYKDVAAPVVRQALATVIGDKTTARLERAGKKAGNKLLKGKVGKAVTAFGSDMLEDVNVKDALNNVANEYLVDGATKFANAAESTIVQSAQYIGNSAAWRKMTKLQQHQFVKRLIAQLQRQGATGPEIRDYLIEQKLV